MRRPIDCGGAVLWESRLENLCGGGLVRRSRPSPGRGGEDACRGFDGRLRRGSGLRCLLAQAGTGQDVESFARGAAGMAEFEQSLGPKAILRRRRASDGGATGRRADGMANRVGDARIFVCKRDPNNSEWHLREGEAAGVAGRKQDGGGGAISARAGLRPRCLAKIRRRRRTGDSVGRRGRRHPGGGTICERRTASGDGRSTQNESDV